MTSRKIIGTLNCLSADYTCMAFDVGRSNTGIAVGNSISRSGRQIGAIAMDNFFPSCWQEIIDLVIKWQVDFIIVGEPCDTPKTAKKMLGFAKAIHERLHLPVVLLDESYTTVTARQEILRQKGLKSLTKKNIDSYSALILIQHWFDLYA